MIVCHCLGVNDREVRRAISLGAKTCAGVTRTCGAGGGCGGCEGTISEILDEELEQVRQMEPRHFRETG